MGKKAKFVRRFAGVRHKGGRGVQNYFGAVRGGSFPNAGVKGYEDGGEWKTFLEQMGDERWHSAADLDAIAGEREITRARVLSASEERRHPLGARNANVMRIYDRCGISNEGSG